MLPSQTDIVDTLVEMWPQSGLIEVDEILAELRRRGFTSDRQFAVKVIMDICNSHNGRYTPGRRGRGSRVTWRSDRPGDWALSGATAPEDGRTATNALAEYRLPVRPGVVATIHVPGDLKRDEAEKVAQFVMLLAV